MPNYHRRHDGTYYFFTLVTQGRRPWFAQARARSLLRTAIARTRDDRPWSMEAVVLLPEHLHMVWRMPEGDADYSARIAILKNRFTRAWLKQAANEDAVPSGQRRQRRRGVLQARFWEHTIRDARDLRLHLDYVHINPVKHGLATRPRDWPHSSFHRYVRDGLYEPDWCGRVELPGEVEYFARE